MGEEHKKTITSLNNIRYLYSDMGGYEGALDYFHQALGAELKVLGKTHPDTLMTIEIMESTYTVEGLRKGGGYVQARSEWLREVAGEGSRGREEVCEELGAALPRVCDKQQGEDEGHHRSLPIPGPGRRTLGVHRVETLLSSSNPLKSFLFSRALCVYFN